MHKILISACLLGEPVRYDGTGKSLAHPLLRKWRAEGRLVPACPELSAGFGVPRPPAEIADGRSGADVLAGTARVIERGGRDVTALYLHGARAARDLALAQGCRIAVLTDGSPSCGSGFIHDGSFAGITHAGSGVTAAMLEAAGIAVFAPTELDEAAETIDSLLDS